MLGMSVVSAENVDNTTTNHTAVKSTKTVTQKTNAETNIIKENSEKTNLIENTNTITKNTTNTTKKITKKTASQTENTKASEAPAVPSGYTVVQVNDISQLTGTTNRYYNITNDLLQTAIINFQGCNVIINGNGHTISYSQTGNVDFANTNANTYLTLYNLTLTNFRNIIDGNVKSINMTNVSVVNTKNCIFLNQPNTVYISDSSFENISGSIFYNPISSRADIINVTTNNVAGSIVNSASNGLINITNSTFINTTGKGITVGSGGLGLNGVNFINSSNNAVYSNSRPVNITNSNFSNGKNSAIVLQGPGSVNITDTSFINNTNPSAEEDGDGAGGGAILAHHTVNTTGYLLVDECVFVNNTATRGGAIFANDPIVLNITSSYFENNGAVNRSSGGGAFQRRGGGGALYMEDGPTLNIINSIFNSNYVTDPVTGSVSENNIVLTETTSEKAIMRGYNNQVDGVYITDVASEEYGVYAKSQDNYYGFHTYVQEYDIITYDEELDIRVNETQRVIIHAYESGFNTEMNNIPIHVTIHNPNDTYQSYDLFTDDDGIAYFDYKSDVSGTLTITVSIDDIYGLVLRDTSIGPQEELVYGGTTSTFTHTVYRLNTTTICNDTNFNSPARIYRDFNITVTDSNGNPVTDGSVDLVVDGNVEDTAEVDNGHAYFHYAFTSAGTKTVVFNYTGTQQVYNSSQTSIIATLSPISPTLNVVAHNVHINQSANVEISLTYGDNQPAPYQKLTVIIGEDNHQEDVYTDANGRVIFTNYTFGEYRDSITVRVQYAGNYSAGFTSCSEAYDTYVNDKYSSHMTLSYTYENRIGTLTLTLKGENGENITTTVQPHITITGDNDVRIDRTFDVNNGVASITIDEMLIHPEVQQAIWLGDARYYPCSTDVVLTDAVFPSKVNIVVPDTVNVGEEFDILIELTTEDGSSAIEDADIYVSINGEQPVKYETNTNGHVNLAYTPSDNSTITIYAEFQGNPLFDPSDDTEIIDGSRINRIPTFMTIGVPSVARVNQTFYFNVSLTDSRNSINTKVDKEPITVLVYNQEVTATFDINRNVYVASYKPLDNSDIIINASYAGSTVYMPVNASNTQLDTSRIEKIGTHLVVSASPSSVYATRPVTIHVLLTNADGTAISGRINLTINGTREEVDIGVEG
jgi:hypothetical protein